MSSRLDWPVGVIAATAIHTGIVAAVMALWWLDPVPQQDRVVGHLEVDVVEVLEQRLSGVPATGGEIAPSSPDGGHVTVSDIPQVTGRPVAPGTPVIDALAPAGAVVDTVADIAPRLDAMSAPQGPALEPSGITGGRLAAVGVNPDETVLPQDVSTQPVPAMVSPAAPLAEVRPDVGDRVLQVVATGQDISRIATAGAVIMAAAAPGDAARAQRPRGRPLSTAPVASDQVVEVSLPGRRLEGSDAGRLSHVATTLADDGDVAAAVHPAPVQAPEQAASGERMTAGLAWSGAGNQTLAGADLGTIETLLFGQQPSSAGENLRDDIANLLAGPPCSRLQTVFLPETGTLELRGHIPDAAMAPPLLAALANGLPDSIPVRNNLRILPSPQCDALTGIDALGLPQSTDQLTNPALIGENAHVREFRFLGGQNLVLDVRGADYPAYVYVDYYAADGSVLHLVPSRNLPLQQRAKEEEFHIGERDAGADAPFRLVVGPPFGQEIAVALAVSEPLYPGLRPFSEPAAAYLDDLRARIAEARARAPDFKGEWIYFFITTRPPG